MKFTVTMKTPDALENAIAEAFEDTMMDEDDLQDEIDKVNKICKKWFKYGEYLTVEIDTEWQTCEVTR